MSQKNKFTDANRIKSSIKVIFGLPLTFLSFLFIFRSIALQWKTLYPHLFHVNISLVLLGMGFLIMYFFIRGLLWNLLLKKQGYNIPFRDSLFLYTSSELRRYIPGNVFSLISRATLFKKYDVPAKVSARTLVIEALVIVCGASIACIPSGWVVFSTLQKQLKNYVVYHGVTAFTICIVGILIFSAVIFLLVKLGVIKRIRKISFRYIFSYKEYVFLAFLGWFFFGWGNYFLAASVTYLSPVAIMILSSLFVLSWAIGYLSIVTPMGLGVREAAVTEGLSFITHTSLGVASFISLFSRIALIIAELIFYVLVFAISKVKTIEVFYKKFATQTWILHTTVLSYIGYFAYVTFQKQDNFFTGRFDLGNMDQVVWNTLHGHIFLLTNPDSTNIISRLGIHADFMLILLAPFYLIWQDPRMLLLIQTVAIACGAYFVYLIAQNVCKDKTLSLFFGLSYLFNPWIERQNLYDFHAVTLATPLLLGSFYFLEKRRYMWFGVFLFLAALTKENVFLIASFFGIYLIIKKKYFSGITLAVSGAVIFYLLIAKFIPDARGSAHFALSFFTDYGDSPSSVLKSIFFNPVHTITEVATVKNLIYLHTLLIPTGYLSLLSPLYLIFSAPELGIYMLSANDNFRSMNFHYGAAIVPFVYISSLYGTQWLLSQKKIKITLLVFLYYVGLTTLLTAFFYGVLPGSAAPETAVFTQPLENRKVILDFLATIPKQYSVAATNNLGAHLSHRERIYTIPNGIDKADIILFLLNDQYAQPSLSDQERMVVQLSRDPRYTQVFEDDPFIVFAKSRVQHLDVDF